VAIITHFEKRKIWPLPLQAADVFAIGLVGLVAAFLLLNVALRSAELDEGYSLALLAGLPVVDWPDFPFQRDEVAAWFGRAPMASIAHNLRLHDVHPPLWFYAAAVWRGIVGSGLVEARLLSVVLTLVNFALLIGLARQCKAPVILSCAIAFSSYAILYTGSTLRMYPLALMFMLSGTWLLLDGLRRARDITERDRRQGGIGSVRLRMALSGASFGLGASTHFLILFPCIVICAVALPPLLTRKQFGAIALLAISPLPALLWVASFFLVQDRRDWQFPPFELVPAVLRLTQHYVTAMLGGTPLLFVGAAQTVVAGCLALVFLAAITVAATGAGGMLKRTEGRVAIAGAVVMPVTLFLLSLTFHRQVSEPRYMLYGVPFLAIVIARGLLETAVVRRWVALTIGGALIVVQGFSAATLPWARGTQQAARPTVREIATVWEDNSILLLPQTADTTGMTLTFLYEADPSWPLRHIRRDEPADDILMHVSGRPRVFLVTLGDDVGQQAISHARAVLERDGWRNIGPRITSTVRQGRVWEEYRREAATTAPPSSPGGLTSRSGMVHAGLTY
jgi:hypothetical protein